MALLHTERAAELIRDAKSAPSQIEADTLLSQAARRLESAEAILARQTVVILAEVA
jgi:hypothetical protein